MGSVEGAGAGTGEGASTGEGHSAESMAHAGAESMALGCCPGCCTLWCDASARPTEAAERKGVATCSNGACGCTCGAVGASASTCHPLAAERAGDCPLGLAAQPSHVCIRCAAGTRPAATEGCISMGEPLVEGAAGPCSDKAQRRSGKAGAHRRHRALVKPATISDRGSTCSWIRVSGGRRCRPESMHASGLSPQRGTPEAPAARRPTEARHRK